MFMPGDSGEDSLHVRHVNTLASSTHDSFLYNFVKRICFFLQLLGMDAVREMIHVSVRSVNKPFLFGL